MEIAKNTLVLVVDKLPQKSLGIVFNSNENFFDVEIIYPHKFKGDQAFQVPSQNLMVISQNIKKEDINDQIAPIIFRLADCKYCHELILYTTGEIANAILETAVKFAR